MGASNVFSLRVPGVRDTSGQEETPKLLQELGAIIQCRNKKKSPILRETLAHEGFAHLGTSAGMTVLPAVGSDAPHQASWLPVGWGITPRRGKLTGFIV